MSQYLWQEYIYILSYFQHIPSRTHIHIFLTLEVKKNWCQWHPGKNVIQQESSNIGNEQHLLFSCSLDDGAIEGEKAGESSGQFALHARRPW